MAPQMRYAIALREITNFLVKGMKLLARVGGGEGRETKVVDKIGAPVSLLSVAFFGFSRLGFLAGIFGSEKKWPGTHLLDPLVLIFAWKLTPTSDFHLDSFDRSLRRTRHKDIVPRTPRPFVPRG